MAKEIERKFLVTGEGWRDRVMRKVHLRDGILAFAGGRKVRIRFYDGRATLTVKGPRIGISRDEFEYDIPGEDGLVLLEQHCGGGIQEKTRHHVLHGGFEWTVDEYHGLLAGVVMAEIELPSEEAEFPHPPWLGREVTGLPEYRQANMAEARRQRGNTG
ncbi:CYTH domain-containing protein [Mangrovicoccus sp. HB161399]|uniref:CYTH domain-containing protein n=1 Tax=Mangrovicoccus sp. HB161399 TaxID=2720392 RepID=UPI001557E63B|nr:CYTH domain-containing protein [Mangrovicoccus sp. HB161399]